MPPSSTRGRGRGGRGGNSRSAAVSGSKGNSNRKPVTLDAYYAAQYGDRWPQLKLAMLTEPTKVALWNRFCQVPFADCTRGLVRVDESSISQAFTLPHLARGQQATPTDTEAAATETVAADVLLLEKPPIDALGFKGYYLLDYASVLVVEQLQVQPLDRVLDMCAAPGGKSVAIAQFLCPEGELTSNEAKADRCARLRRTLREHIPDNAIHWKTVQRDAQTWYSPEGYQRVLIDAPCSSERHLIQQAGGASNVSLRDWTVETTEQLASLQKEMLLRGLETCAVGGRVVYSTCSISRLENDGVVGEALRRTRCAVRAVPPEGIALGEPTTHGWILLPDVAQGYGPMFFCVLEKTAALRSMGDSSSSDESSDSDDAE